MSFGFIDKELPADIGTWKIAYVNNNDKYYDESIAHGMDWKNKDVNTDFSQDTCGEVDGSIFKYESEQDGVELTQKELLL